MLDRAQFFHDVTAASAPFVTDVLQDLYRQTRMHIKKDAYFTGTGCDRETTWVQVSSDEVTTLLLKSGTSSWMYDRGLVVMRYDISQWGCLKLRSTSL